MRNEILNKVSVNNNFWLSPNYQELFLLGFKINFQDLLDI